jgi:hypothetical protein
MSSPFSGAGPVFYAWNRGQADRAFPMSHIRLLATVLLDCIPGIQGVELGSWLLERPEE